MSKLLLASNNPGKLQEMQALLQGIRVKIITPSELGIDLIVEEDGQTYAENAVRKALAFAQRAGCLSLGDDSGLEVEALSGAPGVYSHRFSPEPGATDADRRAYLLQQLREFPRPWRARFCCSIALATPAGELYLHEGDCPGEIIPEERGEDGFGYDPIFLVSGIGRTMAELTMKEKNEISHRGRAVQAAIPVLLNLI
jgi:XTP/dITP diphosphohydrolase